VWDGHVATVVGKLLTASRRRPQVVNLRLVAHCKVGLTVAVIALTETAQFCSSKVLTAWLRH
jgi:hypothetical protein